ncbi:uncharacterized protein LOC118487220 [Helianthus annuus]|uniref:uncharacterized protein LOC118487220 n=1 Tax=Helianthus annuus TaxID=4232 RepID=UPI001652FCD7|nr:uncharacterized protein LOC118487220 [Helianthus annuus]
MFTYRFLCVFRRNGIYCQYHKKNATQKYSTKRVEFMGGNLKTAFNFKEKMQSEGIYMVENQTNVSKPGQPKKVFSAEGLRKALRPAYADSDSEETVDSDPYESQLAGDGIGDDGGMR